MGSLFSPFATVVAAAGEGEGGVVAPGRGSQVRSGLAAGGNRIRTLGPALHTYRFGPPSCRFRERAKFAVDLYGAFPVKRLFLGSAASSLFGAGKAVLHPVACDQVPGARGRGQGTETPSGAWRLAALASLVVSQRLDA